MEAQVSTNFSNSHQYWWLPTHSAVCGVWHTSQNFMRAPLWTIVAYKYCLLQHPFYMCVITYKWWWWCSLNEVHRTKSHIEYVCISIWQIYVPCVLCVVFCCVLFMHPFLKKIHLIHIPLVTEQNIAYSECITNCGHTHTMYAVDHTHAFIVWQDDPLLSRLFN